MADAGSIRVVRGDITSLEVDAIVNAANPYLAGGGGVDGAIHRAGGPEIMAETRRRYPDGCPTGSAVISAAGRLRATWVIHAVGPVWHGGGRGERELLASAWRSALQLAGEAGARSIAFPSISTGVYGFPVPRAAQVAVGEVRATLARGAPLDVVICTFSAADEKVYRRALEDSSAPPAG